MYLLKSLSTLLLVCLLSNCGTPSLPDLELEAVPTRQHQHVAYGLYVIPQPDYQRASSFDGYSHNFGYYGSLSLNLRAISLAEFDSLYTESFTQGRSEVLGVAEVVLPQNTKGSYVEVSDGQKEVIRYTLAIEPNPADQNLTSNLILFSGWHPAKGDASLAEGMRKMIRSVVYAPETISSNSNTGNPNEPYGSPKLVLTATGVAMRYSTAVDGAGGVADSMFIEYMTISPISKNTGLDYVESEMRKLYGGQLTGSSVSASTTHPFRIYEASASNQTHHATILLYHDESTSTGNDILLRFRGPVTADLDEAERWAKRTFFQTSVQ